MEIGVQAQVLKTLFAAKYKKEKDEYSGIHRTKSSNLLVVNFSTKPSLQLEALVDLFTKA